MDNERTSGEPEEPSERGGNVDSEHWRPRRPSPLGLMGPAGNDVPRANPWPSLRAIGIMAIFMAFVVALVLIFGRGWA